MEEIVTIKRAYTPYQQIQDEVPANKKIGGFDVFNYNIRKLQPVPINRPGSKLSFNYGIDHRTLTVIMERFLKKDQSKDYGYLWELIDDWYKKLIVSIPVKGLELNIKTHLERVKAPVKYADGSIVYEEVELELPEDPEAYLIYKTMQFHPHIAKDKASINGHMFYMENNNAILDKQAKDRKIKNQALSLKLPIDAGKNPYTDHLMYLYLFRSTSVRHDLYNKRLLELSEAQVAALFDELVLKFPETFIQLHDDKRAKLKWYIEMLAFDGMLSKEDGVYFFEGVRIGSMEDTIKWLQDPANADIMNSLITNLSVVLTGKFKFDTQDFTNQIQKQNATIKNTRSKKSD